MSNSCSLGCRVSLWASHLLWECCLFSRAASSPLSVMRLPTVDQSCVPTTRFSYERPVFSVSDPTSLTTIHLLWATHLISSGDDDFSLRGTRLLWEWRVFSTPPLEHRVSSYANPSSLEMTHLVYERPGFITSPLGETCLLYEWPIFSTTLLYERPAFVVSNPSSLWATWLLCGQPVFFNNNLFSLGVRRLLHDRIARFLYKQHRSARVSSLASWNEIWCHLCHYPRTTIRLVPCSRLASIIYYTLDISRSSSCKR